ncbi:MAG: dicarboxylate/amino acid:cation symporter [Saprospiraceae bacterium]|nr:dicarboxylate/amino acid:cation symporter [Saprospiraceae bacterium]
MRKLELHWKILIGMTLGLLFGILLSQLGLQWLVKDWIKPFGVIFINLLKLIAIPLILVSLIKGISDLHDIQKFKTMGARTFGLYIVTTVLAVIIGLIIVNIIRPGDFVSAETVAKISDTFSTDMETKISTAATVKQGPLQFLVDVVPDNIFGAASNNSNMLKVIFFSVFFGISLLLVDKKIAQPVTDFFTGMNEVIMKMVDLIMLIAPYAVFALLCSLIAETTNPDLFVALSWYVVAVSLGLILMLMFYSLIVYTYGKISPVTFFKAMSPAQLLAFSTSSSAATLPVTMERVEEHLGVEKEVTSFVCPLGATINMDGTSLYQAVAAVFICEAMQFDLTFSDQLTIILTATLASIGSAAVPGAGLIMLVVVLESVGLPADRMAVGLALIFAVDRPLDMFRTVINVTGDSMVAYIVGKSLGKVSVPAPKNWDDNYKS